MPFQRSSGQHLRFRAKPTIQPPTRDASCHPKGPTTNTTTDLLTTDSDHAGLGLQQIYLHKKQKTNKKNKTLYLYPYIYIHTCLYIIYIYIHISNPFRDHPPTHHRSADRDPQWPRAAFPGSNSYGPHAGAASSNGCWLWQRHWGSHPLSRPLFLPPHRPLLPRRARHGL